MADVLQFYIDDSAVRNPDKKPGKRPEHGYDWFALGGILLKEEDESEARERHGAFCQRWNITYPLHSSEIRGRTLNFLWLEDAQDERERFYEGLCCLMRDCPVVGLACVIDRPGYDKRYAEKYAGQRWLFRAKPLLASQSSARRSMQERLGTSFASCHRDATNGRTDSARGLCRSALQGDAFC